MVLSLSIHALVERRLQLAGTLMGGHDVALEVMRYIQGGLIQPIVHEVKLQEIPDRMMDLAACKATVGKIVARIEP